MDTHYICKDCNIKLDKSNKCRHEKSKKHISHKRGGDLQTMSSKLPNFPWAKYSGEHHLPGYSYAGPGTRLDIRLDENDQPKPGEEPINRVDAAAYKHDLAYRNDDIRTRQKADIDLIQDLNEIQNPTLRERIDRFLVKMAMKAKIAFGGEVINGAELAEELHREYRRPKTFLKVKVFAMDDVWGADLVEMPNSKNNNGYKYILTIIDLYTKYAWAIPLKNKTAVTVRNAFEELFENSLDGHSPPMKLYTDNGSEFYNKTFKKFRDDHEIELYSTYNQPDERSQGPSHNPVIERFNRTLKNIMYKKFTERGNRVWFDILDELMESYNNKMHRTIKMSPYEATKDPESILKTIQSHNNENSTLNEKIKFKVGDRVRLFKWKSKFEKGYTHKWSKEIFIVDKVFDTKPVTYKVRDLDDEEVLGRFYTNELTRTNF